MIILLTGSIAQMAVSGDVLTITNATVLDVFFDAETNYRYSDQDALEAEVDRKLNAAIDQGFEKIKEEALADSSGLLSRASIDFGASPDGLADFPTDVRVLNARTDTRDIQLTTLAWNLGRHMLVAAS